MGNVDWQKFLERVWHVGLLVGSTYAASNPKYAWLVPVAQALGQATTQPR